jgi:hypothetical protein
MSITAGQLLEDLQYFLECNPDAADKPIYASCDYGDYGHTQQLIELSGNMLEVVPKKTAYSQSGLAMPRDDEEMDDEGNEVIVI